MHICSNKSSGAAWRQVYAFTVYVEPGPAVRAIKAAASPSDAAVAAALLDAEGSSRALHMHLVRNVTGEQVRLEAPSCVAAVHAMCTTPSGSSPAMCVAGEGAAAAASRRLTPDASSFTPGAPSCLALAVC